MQELIELKKYYEQRVENVKFKNDMLKSCWHLFPKERVDLIEIKTFSEFIEKLDLILNNSVVKPSERQSPTDESFSGCKPPERKAKSTEDKDKCEHLVERAIGQQGELFVCRKCGEHGQHLSIYWA